MYKTLIEEVRTILEGVSSINEIHAAPVKDLNSYPAVVFFPDVTENDWESTKNNLKTYRFKIYVICELLEGTTEEGLFTDILAGVVGDIDTALDENWSLDGARRTWLKLDSGIWNLEKEEDGNVTAYAELDLSIRTLSNIN